MASPERLTLCTCGHAYAAHWRRNAACGAPGCKCGHLKRDALRHRETLQRLVRCACTHARSAHHGNHQAVSTGCRRCDCTLYLPERATPEDTAPPTALMEPALVEPIDEDW